MTAGILSVGLSIFFKTITLFLLGVKILPVMYEETKAANGLGWLRRSLLAIGIVLFATHLIALMALLTAFIDGVVRMPVLSMIITISNSIGGLLVALILYLIYHKDRYANKH